MKNKFLLLFLFCFFMSSLYSQPWLSGYNKESVPNFFEIKKQFHEYWKETQVSKNETENVRKGGWQQFKRWENFVLPRVYPSGDMYIQDIIWKEYTSEKQKTEKNIKFKLPNWNIIGPTNIPLNSGGIGRLNVVAFHPLDSNILFVGSANGGLWKTSDAGSSWTTTSDFLQNISVSDIVIHPNFPDTMYMATGDAYGYEVRGMFWGGTYSTGVMKSSDGGITWSQTSLLNNFEDANMVQRIVMLPSKPHIIFAATRNGIWKSIDAGNNWYKVYSDRMYDIEINTQHDSIIYASANRKVIKSTDYGETWTTVLVPSSNTGRISLAVTKANSDVLYAWAYNGNFFKSTNGAVSFSLKTSPNTAGAFLGYYDMALAVSDIDENIILAGGVDIVQSSNSATSWSKISNGNTIATSNFVHVDNHDLKFSPFNSSVIYSCNDGGLFTSPDNGVSWVNKSDGLAITQFYRLGLSQLNPNLLYGGSQDNGSLRWDGSTWENVFDTDVMEMIVDYTNDSIVYLCYFDGQLQKSDDYGNYFYTVKPASTGFWTTPFVINPINHNSLVAGYSDVYKTINGALSWNKISNNIFNGEYISSLTVAQADTNYIYAAVLNDIATTKDEGNTWKKITSNLPVDKAAITSIAISDKNPEYLWVTFSGFSKGNKVFKSADGGLTWINVSGSLPNIPVNCIVYQNNSSDALYIGTDLGVYYRDNTLGDWIRYNNLLPNVIVNELEIQYPLKKIRAATYGRGIWECDLYTPTNFTNDIGVSAIISTPGLACDSVITSKIIIQNFGSNTITSTQLNYSINNASINTLSWSGSIAPGDTQIISLPPIRYYRGDYFLTAYTTQPNGVIDNNTVNDTITTQFYVIDYGANTPLIEGFQNSFPPLEWNILNPNNGRTWEHNTTVGGFGLSDSCVTMPFYYSGVGQKDYLYTDYYDFTNVISPATLEFNVAYARYNSTYSDSLFVDVSTDCQTNWINIYKKGGTSLASASDQTNIFIPNNTQWRKDIINLNSFIAEPRIRFRFAAKSGNGNYLYLDDININASTTSIKETEPQPQKYFDIYPNPAQENVILYFKNIQNNSNLKVTITNQLGQTVKTISLSNVTNYFNLDISSIKNGLYFISLNSNSTILQHSKVIVNK